MSEIKADSFTSNMKLLKVLLQKEMEVYFLSPLAYAFLGVFAFLSGLFFYLGLGISPEPNLRILIINLSLTLLFLLPLLTMRQFAEEMRTGTFEMLMTSPLPLWVMIAAKWLASVTLCLVLFLGTMIFPLMIAYLGNPDWGAIFAGYVGLILCTMSFVSAGLFASSLTQEPVSAGLIGVLLLLPFWLCGVASDFVDVQWLKTFLHEFSFVTHLLPFSKGLIDSVDVLWFCLFSIFFLHLTWRSVESKRW